MKRYFSDKCQGRSNGRRSACNCLADYIDGNLDRLPRNLRFAITGELNYHVHNCLTPISGTKLNNISAVRSPGHRFAVIWTSEHFQCAINRAQASTQMMPQQ